MQKTDYAVLLDVYGKLLTDNLREMMQMYFSYDLTFSEIAAQKGVSRQSVSEGIGRGKKQLEEFEAAVGVVAERKALKSKLLTFAQSLERRDDTIALKKILNGEL